VSKSVLIADDNTVMRNLVKFYLKEFNFNIIEAKDGIETLSVIKSEDIFILFLDLKMPNLDGFNVANYLKNTDGQTHIISISADLNKENKTLLKKLGVKYFLNKPLDPAGLKAIVDKILQDS